MARRSKYPQELMDRGVRLALESGRPVAQVARDLGIGHEALRKRVRRAEGPKIQVSSHEAARSCDP
jgi:transposase